MKKIAYVLLALVVASTVAGCVGKGKGKTPTYQAPEPIVRKG